MRPSSLIAVVAFLGLVPGTIWAAYAGSDAGLYPHAAIPLVFGGLFSLGLVVVFLALSTARNRLETGPGPGDPD